MAMDAEAAERRRKVKLFDREHLQLKEGQGTLFTCAPDFLARSKARFIARKTYTRRLRQKKRANQLDEQILDIFNKMPSGSVGPQDLQKLVDDLTLRLTTKPCLPPDDRQQMKGFLERQLERNTENLEKEFEKTILSGKTQIGSDAEKSLAKSIGKLASNPFISGGQKARLLCLRRFINERIVEYKRMKKFKTA